MSVFLHAIALTQIMLLLVAMARLRRHAALVHRECLSGSAPVAAADRPLVSVLVPARNEERNLGRCLTSLLRQDHDRIEILVYNDASEDGTRAIADAFAARESRVKVWHGDGPPPGWMGKNWALSRLCEHASGQLLLFTDADTIHRQDSISAGVSYARRHALDALSAIGTLICGSFWEEVLDPVWFATVACFVDPARVNGQGTDMPFASGAFLLVDRDAYNHSGGHAAIKGELVEDIALFAALRRRGLRCKTLLRAQETYHLRMYTNLQEIWEGWSKNASRVFQYLGRGTWQVLAAILAVLLVTVGPLGVVAAAIAGRSAQGHLLWACGPLLSVTVASLLVRRARGRILTYLWSFPLAGVLIAVILLNSLWRTQMGRTVRWKGRDYPGGRPATEVQGS